VKLPFVKSLQLPVPPLAEQQRIVGVLDEAFAGLATAQAHAAQNLQNARALFESHLQSVFTHRGKGEHQGSAEMKKGWTTKPLGDVCEVVGGGTPSKDNPAFYSGKIPWATVRDMRQDVITETECRITIEAVQGSATNVIPAGNVVIATRVGLGKVCLLSQDTAINQDLRGIIPRDTKTLSVRFLFWWLKTMADIIIAEGTGATVQGVKLPFVKSLQIPVPPLAEQQAIATQLDALAAETQRLTRLYEQKQAALAALKKSLLHQAFTGEL
jgi:type I restriction enzyme S subunit